VGSGHGCFSIRILKRPYFAGFVFLKQRSWRTVRLFSLGLYAVARPFKNWRAMSQLIKPVPRTVSLHLNPMEMTWPVSRSSEIRAQYCKLTEDSSKAETSRPEESNSKIRAD
jgi:hypothetical protein